MIFLEILFVVGFVFVKKSMELKNSFKTNGTLSLCDCKLYSLNFLKSVGSRSQDRPELSVLEGQVPWTALIVMSKNKSFCEGTLINHLFIITTASCLDKAPQKNILGVILGVSKFENMESLYTSLQSNNSKFLTICNIIVHEEVKYLKEGVAVNNIALVKVCDFVEFVDNIGPLCLPLSIDAISFPPKGFELKWLKKTPQVYISKALASLCLHNTVYPIPEGAVCASLLESNDSLSFSGKPIVMKKPLNRQNSHYLFAIRSYKLQVNFQRLRTKFVYANISYYMNWIKSKAAEGDCNGLVEIEDIGCCDLSCIISGNKSSKVTLSPTNQDVYLMCVEGFCCTNTTNIYLCHGLGFPCYDL